MENKEKYIQRIKKLLAMARNNSSAEEAALALSRAQRLMETHKLTEADADLMDINEASTQKAPSHAKKMPEYMTFLCPKYGFSDRFGWQLLAAQKSNGTSTQNSLF